jgi:hypothetical protein
LNLGQSVSGCPDLFGANFNVERTIFWQWKLGGSF